MERYARGLRRLAYDTPHRVLVITHDQPIRYLVTCCTATTRSSGGAPVPNAAVYPFAAATVAEGAERLAAVLR